jgi:hypothetical protein
LQSLEPDQGRFDWRVRARRNAALDSESGCSTNRRRDEALIDNRSRGEHQCCMAAVISAPKSWIASVGRLSLPRNADRRLQTLMDANNEGRLSAAERKELAALVEWSENVSLLRAQALRLLGRRPS